MVVSMLSYCKDVLRVLYKSIKDNNPAKYKKCQKQESRHFGAGLLMYIEVTMWSQQESNLHLKFRKLLFYPLNYET